MPDSLPSEVLRVRGTVGGGAHNKQQDVSEEKEETFSVPGLPPPRQHRNNRGFDRESRSRHSFTRGRCHMAITSETYLFLWVSIPGLHFSISTTRPVGRTTRQSVSRTITPTLGDKQGFSTRKSQETRK